MTPPIESPRYHQDEIKEKFEGDGYDWEQVKKTLDIIAKREEVDRKLAELEGDTDAYYSYLENLVKKEQEGSGFDFSDFSLASLKEKAEAGVAGAQEAFKAKETELLASAEERVRESLGPIGKIPMLGEWLVSFITGGIKEKYETGKNNVGVFIGGFWGIKGIGFFKNLISGDTKENSDIKPEVAETPVNSEKNEGEESGSEGTTPEVVQERFDITKKGVYESTGFDIIAIQSGIENTENPNTSAIYRVLSNKGFTVESLRNDFFSVNIEDTGAIMKVLGIGDEYSETEVKETVLGIIGPFNDSFLRSTFNQAQDIKDILFIQDGKTFKPIILQVLTPDEIKGIRDVNFDYSKIDLSVLARIISIFWENKSMSSYNHVSKISSEVGHNIQSFLFGRELNTALGKLGNTERENIFPQRVALLFKDLNRGGAHLKTSRGDLISEFGDGLAYNETEQIAIDKFIGFRDEVLGFIPSNTKYSLGMNNFENTLRSKVNYQNLATLYILTQGKPLSQLDATDSLIVYAWIHQIMGDDQGDYEAAIIDSLKDDSNSLTDDELNILTVIFFRLLENNRSRILGYITNKYDLVHGTLKNTLPDNIDNGTKDYLAWGIEMGGAIGLWGILSFAPYVRGAMIVTTGLTLGAVLIFSQEGMYRYLRSSMQEKFDSFLMDNLEGDSPKEIRDKINNGEIGPDQLLLSLTDTDFTGLFS